MYQEIIFTPSGGGGGASTWAAPVANLAALPGAGVAGETRVVLDIDRIYIWDTGTLAWVDPASSQNFILGVAPPGAPIAGMLWGDSVNSLLYQYDAVRTKWLGLNEQRVSAARNSTATNLYLYGESVPTNLTAETVNTNSTLVGLVAVSRAGVAQTWTAEVRINGNVVPIASVNVVAGDFAISSALNIDVSANDRIELYMNGSTIQRPRIDAIFRSKG